MEDPPPPPPTRYTQADIILYIILMHDRVVTR